MYKAVFIDIDGTLLKDDHSISSATKKTIQRVCKKGVAVVLVSARPLDAITPIIRQIGNKDFPVVCLNGAYITDKEVPIFESHIDNDLVKQIEETANHATHSIVYYIGREWYAEANTAMTQYEQEKTKVKLKIDTLPNLLTIWDQEKKSPNKILIMGEADKLKQSCDQLIKNFSTNLNIYFSKPTYLEIINKDASKDNAIRFLIGRMNIDPEEIITIGDNFNDKGMIEMAGMGVAMGNAPKEIKEAANFITDTNNNDGVRKLLDMMLP